MRLIDADKILEDVYPVEIMEQGKIECAKAEDRDNLVMILARNGYTVRQIREKKPKGNAYSYYVEYSKT